MSKNTNKTSICTRHGRLECDECLVNGTWTFPTAETSIRQDERNKVLQEVSEIVGKWMSTSNPAYAQDLFDLLTFIKSKKAPTKTDKQELKAKE